MGYYCNREIASINEPSEIVLANSPNFVVFSGKKSDVMEQYLTASMKVISIGTLQSSLRIEITEKQTGRVHTFHSTHDPKKVNENTFFVVSPGSHFEGDNYIYLYESSLYLTAQNIRNCLLKNSYLKNNFEITTDILKTITKADTLKKFVIENYSITIKSKGFGPQYDFSIDVKYDGIEEIEPDFSISLNNFDFSTLDISNCYLSIEGHYLRVAIITALYADYTRNDTEYFKVVLPQAGVTSVEQARLATLKNLRDCILRQDWVCKNVSVVLNEKNLTIYCSYINYNNSAVLDDINSSDNIISAKRGNVVDYLKISTSKTSNTTSSDIFDYGTGSYQIELDVYTNHQTFPGTPDTFVNLGSYMTTLSKSYFGKPLWFDLSTLLSKKATYSPAFLTELELEKTDEKFQLWSNANTMTDYRFIAKRTDGVITEPFYYSPPLYILNGYNYTLDPLNLEEDESGNSYILDFSQDFYKDNFVKVKPLTTNFARTHIKGQRQYFTYIHKYIAPTLRIAGADNLVPSIGLHYKIYTHSGTLIGAHTENGQEVTHEFIRKVNTTLVQLDQFLPMYNDKTVGRIDVYLCRWHKSEYLGQNDPEVIVSTPLSFRILPEVLNEVNDFVFLNQLGGWDTMNFGGDSATDFKTSASTIYKTLLPGSASYAEIESVAAKNVQEQKTVQTSPISKQNVEWLRQMSASPAVYELSTKRYILIDDMSLKYGSPDDLYLVEMKYHYTDSFK